jgi:hypothetical protein
MGMLQKKLRCDSRMSSFLAFLYHLDTDDTVLGKALSILSVPTETIRLPTKAEQAVEERDPQMGGYASQKTPKKQKRLGGACTALVIPHIAYRYGQVTEIARLRFPEPGGARPV